MAREGSNKYFHQAKRSKNDEFLEGGEGRQRKSLTPPDPQLTIVKIDNIQKNNKKNKQTNSRQPAAHHLQKNTCK